MATTKNDGRARRKRRIRKKIAGDPERPRLTVFRSNKAIYAQVIDDAAGATLAAASSHGRSAEAEGGKVATAEAVGEALAQACVAKGIEQVRFDRNGYMYHGRVKALADGARKGGLRF
ncbi:MAG: 50S ribosomal protein L18 [Myxococcales bacterium]|nr:50S ribosomal protein L18 [Myxococcales bacterium]